MIWCSCILLCLPQVQYVVKIWDLALTWSLLQRDAMGDMELLVCPAATSTEDEFVMSLHSQTLWLALIRIVTLFSLGGVPHGRGSWSCFELLLSIPESELPHEVWLGFHQSIQDSHDALLEFGNNNLQILVDVTREGVWKNPVLLKILSQQPVETEEANKLITREGPSFLQMRIKHLMKSNCIPQATSLSKLCADSPEIANVSSFRQAYITCVCSMLPNEDSIKEIAKVDCKEAEEAGLAVSVLLCVRALQIRSNGSDEMKTSVCKTIACLLPEDLEVRRACQLTEFLLEPTLSGFNALEELYMQPDQKFDEENALVPNSLRCELLLALKAYWPFDPEFWDWKTLKRHCLKLLGKAASDSEDDAGCHLSLHETDMFETSFSDYDETKEHRYYDGKDTMNHPKEKARAKKPIGSSERYQRWLQYKFFCVLCKRECIEARILHHSKMHMEDGIYTCPVCTKKFKRKEFFVPHVMEHVKMPPSRTHRPKKKIILKKERSPQKATASSSPPPAFPERSHQAQLPESFDDDTQEYVTFSQLENCQLQDRDIYPCPGTDCSRVFKQFKYLSVHLKAEHQNNDENAKHYLDMKNRREKCAFCRRHFMTSFHLREHERVHCGPQPYMCVSMDCYARFGSVNELLNHKQTHDDLRYKCELNGCNIVFSDLGQLYHHEAQHFRDASYTCNYFGCKKFYYSKTEFQNHLAAHDIQVSNGEGKQRLNLEGLVSEEKSGYLTESQLLEQSESSNLNNNLDPSGSQEIPQVKEESLSDSEDLISESNCSLHCGEHRAAVSQGQTSPRLLGTVAHNQSVPGYVVSQEGVFHPADMKQQCSNVAVCFDEKNLSCGFEGCCSTHKNSRSMQKHLRRAHPYNFKRKRNMELKTKYFLDLLNDAQDSKSPTDMSPELGHNSDTNADSPESLCCAVDAKGSSGLKEETCPSSPETSFYDSSKEPDIEDNMLELIHSEYYDSLFGNQREEEDNEDKDKNEQNYLKDGFDTSKQNGKQLKEKAKRINKSREKHLLNFKTKEEALQMCKEKSNQTQYPCMVQGCLSVVKLESSIVRHYKRTHQMTNMYIEQRLQKLVLCVKCGIMIEKQSCSDTASDLDKKAVEVNEDRSANSEPVQESDKSLVPNPACDPPDESEGKDDDDDDDCDEVVEWESPEQLPVESCQLPVDEPLQNEGDSQGDTPVNNFESDENVIITPNNPGQLTEIQPLLSESSSAPSLENLRAILDKALTDCGDLALKQLHYLRPVVVLERSKFSTPLIDLFPTKKADELDIFGYRKRWVSCCRRAVGFSSTVLSSRSVTDTKNEVRISALNISASSAVAFNKY
ncbi:hypothetical protein IHE44_0008209 [Lamprotornis superbus]|uniref:C2H2-type domain-containing protein n=1 Tax=Lamprotornis superbus TaxID=245042 RepID=A0A835NQQ9_9PASS|nr:hypothetical protein IHE44_0008209 [Lamprotornis superbus]